MLPIEQVVVRPQDYAHKLVTIHGCYSGGEESSKVQPCCDARDGETVWVEDAAEHEKFIKIFEFAPLVFKYDEAQSRTAWSKLGDGWAGRLEVTMVGQFETGRDFGHLGAYQHQLWLVDVLEAKPFMGDLSAADLADLSKKADLHGANLSEVNLSGLDLRGADLSGANLFRADLSGANLSGLDLSRADLRGANLRGADLSVADLREADLFVADLRSTDLSKVKNLTQEQIDKSRGDSTTKLPANLHMPESWKK